MYSCIVCRCWDASLQKGPASNTEVEGVSGGSSGAGGSFVCQNLSPVPPICPGSTRVRWRSAGTWTGYALLGSCTVYLLPGRDWQTVSPLSAGRLEA